MPQIAETRVRSHLIPRGPRGTWTGCSASRLHMKVMAHAQKPDFVFLRNRRVHLNRQGRQFSRLLAAEVCASAVVMLDTPCSEVVWRVLATHSISQFPLHFPSRASPCAITFQLDSTLVFPYPCHSTRAPNSSSSYYSYQKDKRAKPENLQ